MKPEELKRLRELFANRHLLTGGLESCGRLHTTPRNHPCYAEYGEA